MYCCSLSVVRLLTCSTVVPFKDLAAATLWYPSFRIAVCTTCSGDEEEKVPSLFSYRGRETERKTGKARERETGRGTGIKRGDKKE